MACLGVLFGISNTYGDVWSNLVGQNMEIDEEHSEDAVEKRCPLARVKFGRDGEGGRKALDMGKFSINIWDGSELKLAWSK